MFAEFARTPEGDSPKPEQLYRIKTPGRPNLTESNQAGYI
jgi:hypothetical protein